MSNRKHRTNYQTNTPNNTKTWYESSLQRSFMQQWTVTLLNISFRNYTAYGTYVNSEVFKPLVLGKPLPQFGVDIYVPPRVFEESPKFLQAVQLAYAHILCRCKHWHIGCNSAEFCFSWSHLRTKKSSRYLVPKNSKLCSMYVWCSA